MSPTSPPEEPIPSSILIIGSGVFGLSTAYSLSQNPAFSNTKITLVDRSTFPAPDAASIDSSRIIRADYADIAYARLALRAQERWRNDWWGADGIYQEAGLAVVVTNDRSADKSSGNGELGREYMRKSMENVQRCGLKPGRKSEGGDVEVLDSTDAIRGVFNTGVRSKTTDADTGHEIGDFGYVNWRSGWADAEKGMTALYKRVVATNRVDFTHSTVKRLHFSSSRVTGVELASTTSSPTILTADTIILAAGAWTPTLLDLRGLVSATGQILAYLPLSTHESSLLSQNPTLLNESTGYFAITPSNSILKIARHGYGYSNPCSIPHPENPAAEAITVSIPLTSATQPNLQIPAEGQSGCRTFLRALFPPDSELSDIAERPFTNTRICWYADTARGDWLMDYHPRYENLFVATGGSGHAYKFLPVVGDCIVEALVGRTAEEFVGKWGWPLERGDGDQVWTEDWRGGRKGMVLEEEFKVGKGEV